MYVLRLKETMLMNKVEFTGKTVFFLVRPKLIVCCVKNLGIVVGQKLTWRLHIDATTVKVMCRANLLSIDL